MSAEKLVFEQLIACPAAHVYQAFTNSTMLRKWMCDVATVSPKPGGRFYAAWINGFYTSGEYTRLETDRLVGFQWFGRGDPAPTQVEVTFNAKENSTLLHLEHRGLGVGEEWDTPRVEIEKGWNKFLENLAAVVGSGEDLRITRRPMLGVLWGEFTSETAQKMGVPVTKGVRLGGVVEGLGAYNAGLHKDDVLVSLDGQAMEGWDDLAPVLQRHRAGDKIEVTFYRGAERKQIELELARRPMPEIPSTIEGLAAAIKRTYEGYSSEIDKVLGGVTDEEAAYRPSPDEWGMREILMHLIQSERYEHANIVDIVNGHEPWQEDFTEDDRFHITGMLAAYPKLKDLVNELKRVYAETIGLFGALPKDLPENKARYWFLAYNSLQPPYHFQEHIGQIHSLIAAARGG